MYTSQLLFPFRGRLVPGWTRQTEDKNLYFSPTDQPLTPTDITPPALPRQAVKVENFYIQGLEAFFRSNDHHPTHFHVKKKGEWEIRVYIITSTEKLHYSVKFPKNKKQLPSSKEEKSILDFVIKNREKLYLDWEAKVCVKEKMSDD